MRRRPTGRCGACSAAGRAPAPPPAWRGGVSPPPTGAAWENGLAFSWINLDFFVQFGAFQRVTGNPKQKNVAHPGEGDLLRGSRKSAPPHHPAKGVEPQIVRTLPVPSMSASLSVPPPRRLIRKANAAWISENCKNKTRIFWAIGCRKLAPGKHGRKARGQEAARTDSVQMGVSAVMPPQSVDALRMLETNSAAAYFRAWRATSLVWRSRSGRRWTGRS